MQTYESAPLAVAVPEALGPFKVTRVLGQGGSGTVFAAERWGRELALKVLRDDVVLSSREHRRFLEEAARLRRLEHPAIVPLVDAGTLDDGRPYLAMPLLSGETLARRLRRGPLEPKVALAYFAQLADAVGMIHRSGLVHRDIKPENVVLCRQGGDERPVLLDLGIARDAGDSRSTTTEQGKIRGTPAYMAPERFFGVAASTATDIYELAVLLFMMLVGALPWSSSESPASRLHPKTPGELGVTLPEALETALLRALSTRPEMRPESAEEFAEQVRQGAAGQLAAGATNGPTSEALADTVLVSIHEKPRKGRWLLPAVGAATAAFALALGTGAALRGRARPAASDVPTSTSVAADHAPVAPPASAPPEDVPAATAEPASSPSPAPSLMPSAAHTGGRSDRGSAHPAPARKSPRAHAAPASAPAPSAPAHAPTAAPAPPDTRVSPAPASADRFYQDRK